MDEMLIQLLKMYKVSIDSSNISVINQVGDESRDGGHVSAIEEPAKHFCPFLNNQEAKDAEKWGMKTIPTALDFEDPKSISLEGIGLEEVAELPTLDQITSTEKSVNCEETCALIKVNNQRRAIQDWLRG